MLSAHLFVSTLPALHSTCSVDDRRTNAAPPSFRLSIQPRCFAASKRRRTRIRNCNPKSILVSCKSSSFRRGSFIVRSSNRAADHRHDYDNDDDEEFLPASLLVPETMMHYRMRRQGFLEDMKWQAPGGSSQLFPIPARAKESRGAFASSIGRQFLRRFQSPSIFLKISCDGDFLLPIIVGEFAVEKLLDSLLGHDKRDCPDQFQFVTNLVDKLGYEVNMVRITERVVNTYFAKLYLSKPAKHDLITVDVRPSDAINVANRCKAPIYVNKQIVLADAIRIGYGMGRVRDAKPTYDVYLDSATEGPDSVAEELDLVRDMDTAVKEERYKDAAKLRDKLTELRKSRHDH